MTSKKSFWDKWFDIDLMIIRKYRKVIVDKKAKKQGGEGA